MKTVLLMAYTNINFGDDMFIKTVCDRYPKIKFELNAPSIYKQIFQNTSNLKIINRKYFKMFQKILNKFKFDKINDFLTYISIKKYDAILYVTGGIFDEESGWNNTILKNGLANTKKALWGYNLNPKVPFYFLGSNMARIKSEEYINQMTYMFSDIADVCFRDRYSYNYFSHLSNVRYASDVVFNYNCKNTPIRKNNIIISVWGVLNNVENFKQWKWAEQYWIPYKNFIISIINEFKNKNQNIFLLSLCEREGDLQAANAIFEECNCPENVHILNYNGNIDDIINLFETSKFVVGTRFHSIVLSLNSNTPFFPIIYEEKTRNLLNDIGYSAGYSDIKDIETYEINKVVESFKNFKDIDCHAIKELASKQFYEFEKHVNKDN